MCLSRIFSILGLIIVGIVSQLLPHPPNFSIIGSIALFGPCFLGNLRLSFAVVFIVMLINDMIFGFHSTIPFVYFSLGLIILAGDRFTKEVSFFSLPLVCTSASLLFFILTNFGVWATSNLYPKTLEGLALCYVAAIPFFINKWVGDLVYGFIFYCIKKTVLQEFGESLVIQ